ncbi:hypothetical protein, partial [Chromobacterium amazonense]|uniref:hypothetical protein n=1 Tax=Chromobacterium amazonense TaxID=1382803 RepID=UPI0031F6EDD8
MLIGITYLFAIAQKNGTIDLLVHWAVKAVRGHIVAIPWVMFVITAVLTAFGALAVSSTSRTAGRSRTRSNIAACCAPWPGQSRARLM